MLFVLVSLNIHVSILVDLYPPFWRHWHNGTHNAHVHNHTLCTCNTQTYMYIHTHNTTHITMCTQDDCPLYVASQEGHDKTVKILLQAGATVDLQNKVESYYLLLWDMVCVQTWVILMALHASCGTSTSIDNLTSMLVSMLTWFNTWYTSQILC